MEHAIWLLYFSVKQFCYPKISLWHRPLDYFIRFYDEVERVQWLQSTSEHMVFFKNGLFPASFSFLFSSFQYNTIHLTVNNNCSTKICRCLDSNRGPLVSEATALPTEPQPLPKAHVTAMTENTHCRGEHHCVAGLQFYKVALDCFTKYK